MSKNGSEYWEKKTKRRLVFVKSLFKAAINHLIEDCFFNARNVTMKQAIGIPMGIDPAPFWANLFLYSYEGE